MEEKIKEILAETGAVLSGHFLLSSGKHSESAEIPRQSRSDPEACSRETERNADRQNCGTSHGRDSGRL